MTGLQLKRNKRGDLWAIATVEDLEGSVEVLFFPNAYVQFGTMLANDVVVAVRGRVSHRDESVSLIASDLTLPDVRSAASGPVMLSMPVNRATASVVGRLREVLQEHPGGTEVRVRLTAPGGPRSSPLTPCGLPSPALYGDLKALLGPACLGG